MQQIDRKIMAGRFGGIFWILRPSARSGLITPEARHLLVEHIRSRPSFIKQEADESLFIMGNPNPNFPAGIGFTTEGLYIEWDDFDYQWCRDLYSITRFAQVLGLRVYDIDDGYEEIEQEIIDSYRKE